MAQNDDEVSEFSVRSISESIFFIRGQKVMLSHYLAVLYDIEPRALVQAVKRNFDRFPEDFMFQLTKQEVTNLKSQTVISSWGGSRALPYAFTQEGVAMLSSVLRSRRAIKVNIEIMRAFVRFRALLTSNEILSRKLDELDHRVTTQDSAIAEIIQAIRQLMAPPEAEKKRPIGFAPWEKSE